MGPTVIYHLVRQRNSSTKYMLLDYDSAAGENDVQTILRLPGGDVDRASIAQLKAYGILKIEELPFDVRKWPQDIRAVLAKCFYSVGHRRLKSLKVGMKSASLLTHLTNAAGAARAEESYLTLRSAFTKQQPRWEELLSGFRPQPPKIKSRRIKQKLARRKAEKSKGAAFPPVNPFAKPAYIEWNDGGNDDAWPKELLKLRGSARNHLGYYYVINNAVNHRKEYFKDWYASEGMFLDSTPDVILSKWQGIEKANLGVSNPVCRIGGKMRLCQFMRSARTSDERDAPKPIGWPLRYYGRLGSEEEVRALNRDLNANGDNFLIWLYKEDTQMPTCRSHVGYAPHCLDCAAATYKKWLSID